MTENDKTRNDWIAALRFAAAMRDRHLLRDLTRYRNAPARGLEKGDASELAECAEGIEYHAQQDAWDLVDDHIDRLDGLFVTQEVA